MYDSREVVKMDGRPDVVPAGISDRPGGNETMPAELEIASQCGKTDGSTNHVPTGSAALLAFPAGVMMTGRSISALVFSTKIEDPYLYNDQLQGPSGKFHIPQTVLVAVFEHLDWYYKLIYRRVSRTWKWLLEKDYPVSLVKVTRVPVPILYRDNIIWGRGPKKYAQAVTSVKTFFQEKLYKSRVVIVDYADFRITATSTRNQRYVWPLLHHRDGALVNLLRASQALQHFVFHNDQYEVGHIDHIGLFSLHGLEVFTPRTRPLRFTLSNCSLKVWGHQWTLSYVAGGRSPDPWPSKTYKEGSCHVFFTLFSESHCEVVNLSTFTCQDPSEADVEGHILSNIRLLCLPNYTAQLDWLAKFRDTQCPRRVALDTDEWDMLDHHQRFLQVICVKVVKVFENLDQNGGLSTPMGSSDDFFTLKMAVSFIARTIADGKFDFPPPPQPVPLCPLHTTSAICTCPLIS